MAVGFTKDGAVQDQIDDTINDAIVVARNKMAMSQTNKTIYCFDCDEEIPLVRRKAIKGVERCINCQSALEKEQNKSFSGMNRRASKDALLR